MQANLTRYYIVLIALTFLVVLIGYAPHSKLIVLAVMGVSLFKFLLVGFQYMELTHAHRFWQVLLTVYGSFIALLFMLLV